MESLSVVFLFHLILHDDLLDLAALGEFQHEPSRPLVGHTLARQLLDAPIHIAAIVERLLGEPGVELHAEVGQVLALAL